MSQKQNILNKIQDILIENRQVLLNVSEVELNLAKNAMVSANRIFFMGTGRSGLALKMAAMRFMHLGLNVFVVGEIVTPAILENDILIVASGSGTTSTVLIAAEKAKKVNTKILAITTNKDNPLAEIANHIIQIPAAQKTDFSENISQQYAGSLFEQSTLFVLDAIFSVLWENSGKTKEELWPKHANLE
ncbi:6-phospho-3-hexuloisomerase [Rhizosphaericola mali]|uniref:6-phospho-3-hexuloisomerase n=1 Tax=Rhizosphaericola mali TaxID=2545455 RepID=A0A5P2G148_9BACT|nr:6-phospho-3-hexuloisomerase [Rhizosphaericola mali]QES88398.1 6-phospho-3-hexuloisomerase [Rhizosphaericola mali]